MERSELPYTNLSPDPTENSGRKVDIYTDLYRIPSAPGQSRPSRLGATFMLTMLSVTLGVCLLVLTLAHPSASSSRSSRTFNILGEVDTNSDFTTNQLIEQVTSHHDYLKEARNNRPIIGILSQELDEDIDRKLPKGHNYTSYIAASYVKWVESGGARVVPIIIGKPKSYYEKLFAGLNGLLIPGGSAPLTGPGGYAEVGDWFFEMAKKANDDGDYFPIWGTCNGFELLTVLSVSDDQSRLTDCYSEDQALPLHLRGTWRQSRIYGQAPKHIIRDLTKERVTINFHHFCLSPTNFTKFKMNHFWNALSVNRDFYDLEYISTIEAKNYPFIGVQFHPEKNIFEWTHKEANIPHSRAAVDVASYMSKFFIDMSRQSQHQFADDGELYNIYNYNAIHSGSKKVGMSFEQMYAF